MACSLMSALTIAYVKFKYVDDHFEKMAARDHGAREPRAAAWHPTCTVLTIAKTTKKCWRYRRSMKRRGDEVLWNLRERTQLPAVVRGKAACSDGARRVPVGCQAGI